MISFTPVETLFSVSGVHFSTTGIFIMVGVLLAYTRARKTAERRGLSVLAVDDMTIAMIISGIIGARLSYIGLQWPYYKENLVDIIKIWEGGLDAFGAIIGALFCMIIYIKKKKLKFWYYADTYAPYFLLSTGSAELGNFFAWQDMGKTTDLPWGVVISNDAARHPTTLYGFLILTIGFVLMRTYQRRHPEKYAGYFFFLAITLYFTQAFLMEFLKEYESIFKQSTTLVILLMTAYTAWQQSGKEERKKKLRKGLDARTTQW